MVELVSFQSFDSAEEALAEVMAIGNGRSLGSLRATSLTLLDMQIASREELLPLQPVQGTRKLQARRP